MMRREIPAPELGDNLRVGSNPDFELAEITDALRGVADAKRSRDSAPKCEIPGLPQPTPPLRSYPQA